MTLSKVKGNQLACESKQIEPLWGLTSKNACRMQNSTVIDTDNVKVLADSTVQVLTFEGNPKISFLPIEVGLSFPHLLTYSAWNCSISAIAKVHFKGLSMLEDLYLDGNQIKTIRSDTFEELLSLQYLHLRK